MDSNEMNPALKCEIKRYLKTGDHDQYYRAWPAGSMLLSARKVSAALREALIEAVRIRARDGSETGVAQDTDLGLTSAKVRPMVNGLFPVRKRTVVISVLEKSGTAKTTPTRLARFPECKWYDCGLLFSPGNRLTQRQGPATDPVLFHHDDRV